MHERIIRYFCMMEWMYLAVVKVSSAFMPLSRCLDHPIKTMENYLSFH